LVSASGKRYLRHLNFENHKINHKGEPQIWLTAVST
jgi:hypothetical protein